MKHILLMIATAAPALFAGAQQPSRGELPDKAYIYYYPFYNGVQMIEVDLLTPAFIEWDLRAMRMSQMPPKPSIANPIILRNRQGTLLHQYNTHGRYKASDFATADAPVTRHHAGQLAVTGNSGEWQGARYAPAFSAWGQHLYSRRNYLNQPATGFYPVDYAALFYYYSKRPQHWQYYHSGKGPLPFKQAPAGRLVVYENGLYGLIDTLGQVVMQPQFDDIEYCHNGILVTKAGRMGLLHPDGTERIAPRFAMLLPINDSLLLAKGERIGVVDKDGRLVLDSVYDELIPTRHFIFYRRSTAADTFPGGQPARKYGILNSQLQQVREPRYFGFRHKMLYPEQQPCIYASNGKAYGLLDSLGRELSPFYFAGEHAQFHFYNGACIAEIKDTTQRGHVTWYALVDSHFSPLGNGRFGSLRALCTGYYAGSRLDAKGSAGNNYALVNSNGAVLTPFVYQQIVCMQNGYFDVVINGRHGLLNPQGEQVLPPVYDYLAIGRSADTIKACMQAPPPAVPGVKAPPPVCKVFVVQQRGLAELR